MDQNPFLRDFMKMRQQIVGKEKEEARPKPSVVPLGSHKQEITIKSLAHNEKTTKKDVRLYFCDLRDKLQDEAEAKDA